MDTEIIKLTKDNYKEYYLNDVVALSLATGNAMGAPGAIEIITSNGGLFYANPDYEDITLEQVYTICPIFSEIDYRFFERTKSPRGWE